MIFFVDNGDPYELMKYFRVGHKKEYKINKCLIWLFFFTWYIWNQNIEVLNKNMIKYTFV